MSVLQLTLGKSLHLIKLPVGVALVQDAQLCAEASELRAYFLFQ